MIEPTTSYDASRPDAHALAASPGLAAAELVRQLHEQCATSGLSRCVLLTGPAILEPFTPDELDALREAGDTVANVPLRPDRVGPAYWPSLIELDLDRAVSAGLCDAIVKKALHDWEPESLARGQGHRIGAFLLTDAPLDRLVSHLANLAIQQRSDRPGQRLLAISDPAAFEGLWRVCSDAQRRHLLGPVGVWRTLGRWAQWTDYRCSQPGAAEAPEGRFLGLDDDQWQALFDVRPINRAWSRMRAEGGIVRRDDFEQLPRTLLRAHGYGLGDPQDLELFALHALDLGADFDLHPRMQTLLHQRDADTFYSRAAAELSEADWSVIRAARERAPAR